jgi:hypothetical protein
MGTLLTLAVAWFAIWVGPTNDATGKATIDDYPGGGGYEIVDIDGKAPTRASHPFLDMVPYVLAPAGTHVFKAKPLGGGKEATFNATVAADRRYRVAANGDGKVALVETKP